MNCDFLLFFLVLTITALKASTTSNNEVIQKLLRLIVRRYSGHRTTLRNPRRPEHLPRHEGILPGHTLIRPAVQMLKSSVKYPQKDLDTSVYGNLANLGITYGKTPNRILYSGFRRSYNHQNILESTIQQAVKNLIESNKNKRSTDVIILEATASDEQPILPSLIQNFNKQVNTQNIEENNDAREILDVLTPSSEEYQGLNTRRNSLKSIEKRTKYRNRNRLYPSDNSSSAITSETSSESDYDKNPGNPFTLHKGKYLQNWMWNHNMDGDHMNVNPFAPYFNSLGPTGVGLFFGRKWWYFNQDDYKALR